MPSNGCAFSTFVRFMAVEVQERQRLTSREAVYSEAAYSKADH